MKGAPAAAQLGRQQDDMLAMHAAMHSHGHSARHSLLVLQALLAQHHVVRRHQLFRLKQYWMAQKVGGIACVSVTLFRSHSGGRRARLGCLAHTQAVGLMGPPTTAPRRRAHHVKVVLERDGKATRVRLRREEKVEAPPLVVVEVAACGRGGERGRVCMVD